MSGEVLVDVGMFLNFGFLNVLSFSHNDYLNILLSKERTFNFSFCFLSLPINNVI